jgi:hypothetical protein
VRDPKSKVIVVQELVDKNMCRWGEDTLQENFIHVDVKAICAIHVAHLSEDDWAWSLENRGNFTVRSALIGP